MKGDHPNKCGLLLETISNVPGLAPEALDSLEKLANALDNSPSCNVSVTQAIDQNTDTTVVNHQLATKAASSSFYNKAETDTKLKLKANRSATYTKGETTSL